MATADPVGGINEGAAEFQRVAIAAQIASTKVAQASMVTAAVTGTNTAGNEVAKNVGSDLRQAGAYVK
jgi:hypothetical protein